MLGALPALAAVLAAAVLDGDVGIAVEGRGTVLDQRYLPETSRAATSTTGRVGLRLVEPSVARADLSYSATAWSSNLGAQPSPFDLVCHRIEGRTELESPRWRLSAGADAVRGQTDPFALLPGASGASQVGSTDSIRYQALHAQARTRWAATQLTELHLAGDWGYSGVLSASDRTLMPPQRGAGAEVGAQRRLTERDTLALVLTGRWTETNAPAGRSTGLIAGGEASWRRMLSPTLQGWATAGAVRAYTDDPDATPRRDVLPVGEIGASSTALADRVSGEVAVRLSTFVDRFTGDVRQAADGRLVVSWRATESVTVSALGDARRRIDGETTLASGTLRLAWAARTGLTFTGGALVRSQRERRVDLPSFIEYGAFLGVQAALDSATFRPR